MLGTEALPGWVWALGVVLSYVLLIRVQPMRDVFARGFQIVKRYQHLVILFGLVLAIHALWLWLRGDPPIPAPTGQPGYAALSDLAPYALLGMTEGAYRSFVAFLSPAPLSILVFAALVFNQFGILRELRDGAEAIMKPRTALLATCLVIASGIAHVCDIFNLAGSQVLPAYLLNQGGALFEGFVVLLGQSYIVLYAALGMVTLRRNLKKKEILRIAVRRSPRLWPFIAVYAAVIPPVREFVAPESPTRLALTGSLAIVAVIFAFLQLDILGEKRFSGWRRAMSHTLDLQRRHFHWSLWFVLICMAHWLVFHLVTALLISGMEQAAIGTAFAAAIFAFLQGAVAVWFIGVWAVLYQEKLAH